MEAGTSSASQSHTVTGTSQHVQSTDTYTDSDTHICAKYQAELERKAELQCRQQAVMSDIQTLTKDVHHLAGEIKNACLMKKLGNRKEEDKHQEERELPEDQTYQLCTELMDDQDLITDMVQGLHQQQSQVDSEVAKVMSELKGYYTKS